MRRLLVGMFALLLVGGSVSSAGAVGGVPSLGGRHVYLIIGENTEITQVNKTDARYLMSIKPSGAWLTNTSR